MYNRYLDQMPHTDIPSPPAREPGQRPSSGRGSQPFQRPRSQTPPHSSGRDATPSRGGSHLLEGITAGVGDFLGGILKNFSLDRFDTGDILLVLIILFLLVEGDDLELVITLGLMLLLGLGDDDPPEAHCRAPAVFPSFCLYQRREMKPVGICLIPPGGAAPVPPAA